MAKIDKLSFGSIVIDGKKHHWDMVIFADGTVKKRKGSLSLDSIKKEEIDELAQGEPEAIVIGVGVWDRASLASGVENWAKEKNLSLTVQPSREAAAKLNESAAQKKKVAALIHIFC